MSNNFNFKSRKEDLKRAESRPYDLLIIGGGITGAGIALDAISRGFRTLLLEKSDFASGTSSKSTKLIHGGLRYLKQFEIGLVKETGQERAIVHNLAPHLVHPEKMFLPIVKGGTFGKISASLAISVYDFLAGVDGKDRKESLNLRQTIETEPLVRKDILKGGILYSEYRTDDARLSFEILKKANKLGAEIFNYCRVEDLNYEQGVVDGVQAIDMSDGNYYSFKAKHVISAAGPWVDKLRQKDHSLKGKHLRPTKGVHLVFRHEDLPVKQAIYFDDFEGRMLFAIPRWGVTYLGTTDTDYKGDLDRVKCDESDINYLLKACNNMFENISLNRDDIISTWAGLRPLIAEEGKEASEVSRKDEIFESSTGLLSIAGGKLTGYRKMAERILDLVQEKDNSLPQDACKTRSIKLNEDAFKDYDEVEQFMHNIQIDYPALVKSPLRANYLVSNYGKRSLDIINQALDYGSAGQTPEKALIKAEVIHALENELCWLPEDFLNRRTGMLYFEPLRLKKHFNYVVELFSNYFDWDELSAERISKATLSQVKDAMINYESL